jgi:preprotein translocase SecE subunit
MSQVNKVRIANKSKFNAKKAAHFIGDVKGEFKKIAWTPKDQLSTYTKVVIGSTIALGVFIFSVDLFLRGALLSIDKFIRFFTG